MMMNESCNLDMDMDMDMGMGMMMGGMKMYFHAGACERLLFHSWTIKTVGELVGAVIATFILGILYEGLKTLREWLLYRDIKQSTSLLKNDQYENLNENDSSTLVRSKNKRFKSISISFGMHLLQSILHVVQVGYGYILMLIAMTFNVWLFLAVCFGAGTGYFIFGKARHIFGFGLSSREDNEHCH